MEKVDRSNRKWSSYLSGVGGELLGLVLPSLVRRRVGRDVNER